MDNTIAEVSPPLTWNPRYLAYCRWHGVTPDEMLAHDRKVWPGGPMCGFILWSHARIQEAYKAIPLAFVPGGGLTEKGHEIYDAWLEARVDRELATARREAANA